MVPYQHVRGAGITQLVEYQLPKLDVAGSSPVARSIHVSLMARTPRIFPRRLVVTLWLLALAACAPAVDHDPRGEFDRAVASFVSGDYQATVDRMEKVIAGTDDDAVKREGYTYIGRAQMAMGNSEAAMTAFRLGAHYGDRGPCIAYLEVLKQYVEGDPGALHVREAITRGELAGAIVRMMDEGVAHGEAATTGPTPLAVLASRGWMPALPDGNEHAEDPVTRAALYVIAARILAQAGRADRIEAVVPGGYRQALGGVQLTSGAEALAVLERVRSLKEPNGR